VKQPLQCIQHVQRCYAAAAVAALPLKGFHACKASCMLLQLLLLAPAAHLLRDRWLATAGAWHGLLTECRQLRWPCTA
jgi:hypothetical protein